MNILKKIFIFWFYQRLRIWKFRFLSSCKCVTGKPIVNQPVHLVGEGQIGDNVFIGNNSKIFKGVSIGNDSIIGAGSVVTNSIPEKVVAAGVPAKIIRHL